MYPCFAGRQFTDGKSFKRKTPDHLWCVLGQHQVCGLLAPVTHIRIDFRRYLCPCGGVVIAGTLWTWCSTKNQVTDPPLRRSVALLVFDTTFMEFHMRPNGIRSWRKNSCNNILKGTQMQIEYRERNRLIQLVKVQAKEVDALKAEINMLRRKTGHLYTPHH